jgi:ABC-2 type transport system ATP-binding protein
MTALDEHASTPATHASAAIELDGVTRRFGRTEVVSDLSLRIEPGTTCGLIGLNGAGKTTALRMLMGLLAPTRGRLSIAGCEMPRQRDLAKRRIGYVPDRPTVYPWMTGRAAIDFCRAIHGPRWNDALVDRLARSLRLDLAKPVKHLSKGSAAKLMLLLAVGHDPEVLVLDEPTSGFDVLARDEFLEGILTVNAADDADEQPNGRPGRTILFSSHALADVQRLVDTVAILHRGRLLLHEPIDHLLASTKRIRAVMESAADAAAVAPPGTVRQSRIGREWTVTVKDFNPDQLEFVRTRNRVTSVDVEDLTLDDVFRDYVREAEDSQTPDDQKARGEA